MYILMTSCRRRRRRRRRLSATAHQHVMFAMENVPDGALPAIGVETVVHMVGGDQTTAVAV